MQIVTVKLRNIRAIEELTIELATSGGEPRRRLVLLGPNGCGKTTVLRAIAHVFGTFDDRLGARRLLPSDVRRSSMAAAVGTAYEAGQRAALQTYGLEVDLAAEAPGGEIAIELELTPDDFREIRTIVVDSPRRGWIRRSVGRGLFDDVEPATPFEDAARTAIGLSQFAPCVLLSARRGTLTKPSTVALDAATRFDPKEQCLADETDRFTRFAVLLALAHAAPESYDREKRIRRMWKAIERFLPHMPRAHAVNGLELVLKNRAGVLVTLDELSDGERAVLLIMTDIALRHPANGVVLLDEIEQHLHLRWQTELLDALLALEPSAQFIITTQADYVAASAPRDALRIADWGKAPSAG